MGLNYPKNQGIEWLKMQRQIRTAFTAANSRIPYQKMAAGILKISNTIEILAGAVLEFYYSSGAVGIHMGRFALGSDVSEGMATYRPDGSPAFSSLFRLSDAYGFTGLWDQSANIVVSDDGLSGKGLGRPWIPHTFKDTNELASPPTNRQTSSTSDTAIISTITPIQHGRMSFTGYVYIQTGGSTMELKFKNLTTGVTMYSATVSGGFVSGDFSVGSYNFGEGHQIDVTIRRASGSNNVGFTLLSLHGRQS